MSFITEIMIWPYLVITIGAGLPVENVLAEGKVVDQIHDPGGDLEAADFAILAASLFAQDFVLILLR